MSLVLLREKGDSLAGLAGAAGSSDSVNVILNGKWELCECQDGCEMRPLKGTHGNVDDKLDFGNVQASGRHIGSNQDGCGARLERLETPSTLFLAEVAVDATDADAALL